MLIYFYIAWKDVNSTRIPDGTGAAVYEGALKEPFSIESPIITLRGDVSTLVHRWNYCYIPDFERYYWLGQRAYDSGVWTFSGLICDVLATFKSEILDTKQYVLRAAEAGDTGLIDRSWPCEVAPSKSVTRPTGTWPFEYNLSRGTYILGIINDFPSEYGSTNYYALSYSELVKFCSVLMGSIDWLNIDFSADGDISENFFKTLFNPYQYLVSCRWFPIAPGTIGSEQGIEAHYGWWTLPGTSVHSIDPGLLRLSFGIPINKHPQASTIGKYLCSTPYTRYTLTWEAIGTFDLPTQFLINSTGVDGEVVIDIVTGSSRVKITPTGSSEVMCDVACNFSAEIPISQMGINVLEGITNFTQGLAGSNGIISALGSLANAAIETAVTAVVPEMHTVGSVSSAGMLTTKPQINNMFYTVRAGDFTHKGRPYCFYRTLRGMSGYIQCENAHFTSWGTREENMQVENYLNGGMYIE